MDSRKVCKALTEGYDFEYYANNSDAAPTTDDIWYLYTSDFYKDYCLTMADLAKSGVTRFSSPKGLKKQTDKLNLSGQIARSLTRFLFSITYKPPDKRAGQIQFVRVLKIEAIPASATHLPSS